MTILVQELAVRCEKTLETAGVPKEDRQGCTLRAIIDEGTAKQRRNQPIEVIEMKRGPKNWTLVGVTRSDAWHGPGNNNAFELTLSERAKAAVIAHAMKPFKN